MVVASLALMLAGGVYLAAHLPHPPPLAPAIAGLLAFVFVYDATSASTLAVLLPALGVFAVDVPLVIAFTAASCEPVGAAANAGCPGATARRCVYSTPGMED